MLGGGHVTIHVYVKDRAAADHGSRERKVLCNCIVIFGCLIISSFFWPSTVNNFENPSKIMKTHPKSVSDGPRVARGSMKEYKYTIKKFF